MSYCLVTAIFLLSLLPAVLSNIAEVHGSRCPIGCRDLTRQEGNSGTEVVQATVQLIEQSGIFKANNVNFLRNIAYVATQDGTNISTYTPTYHGGVWRVSESMFDSLRSLDYERATAVHLFYGIDWSNVVWQSLRAPLYSAIAAALYIDGLNVNTSTIEQQQMVWSDLYNTDGPSDFSAAPSGPSVVFLDAVQNIDLNAGEKVYTRFFLPPETSVLQVNLTVNQSTEGSPPLIEFLFSPVVPVLSSELYCGRIVVRAGSSDTFLVSAVHSPYPLSNIIHMTISGALFTNNSIYVSWSYAPIANDGVLPFLDISFNASTLDEDSHSNPIPLPTAFPIGPFSPTTAYIINNDGLISFNDIVYSHLQSKFPIANAPAVGPYWSGGNPYNSPGHVVYAVIDDPLHKLVRQVNDFFTCYLNELVDLQWILVARWEGKCPDFDRTCTHVEPNTYQAVIGTNSDQSFSAFTYKCGSINWGRESPYGSPTVGFSADISFFANHPFSQNCRVSQIDCLNSPHSEWTNVVYALNGFNDVRCTDGNVLLAATAPDGGVLAICLNGEYSTVCRSAIASTDIAQLGEVSCRLLGYDGYIYDNSRTITSAVPVINQFSCNGSYTDLMSCTFDSVVDQSCSLHNDDLEIYCQNDCGNFISIRDSIDIYDQNQNSDIKIISVDYCGNGTRIPVCKDAVSQNEAQLICIHEVGGSTASLGSLLTADILQTEVPYGPAVVAMDCPANATCVEDCAVTVGSADEGCSSGEVAVITCTKLDICYDGQLRQQSGDHVMFHASGYEMRTGRVEVCQNGEYVDVCIDDNSTLSDYFVEQICSNYGSYFNGVIVPYDSMHGVSDAGQYITNISCSHTPHRDINGCQYQVTNTCSSPLVIKCEKICNDGAARLVDAGNAINNRHYDDVLGLPTAVVEGVVEVCYLGNWSSVCNTSAISDNFADLICSTALQYSGGSIVPNENYGYSNSTSVLDSIDCNFASSLGRCFFYESTNSSCLLHENDVAISCFAPDLGLPIDDPSIPPCVNGTVTSSIFPPSLPPQEFPLPQKKKKRNIGPPPPIDGPIPIFLAPSGASGYLSNGSLFIIQSTATNILCINNENISICADSLDAATASLICSDIGYVGRGFPYPLFGSQDHFSLAFTRNVASISCPSSAQSLQNCSFAVSNYSTCSNYLISCVQECYEGDIRHDPAFSGYGRSHDLYVTSTLVCVNGEFIPICSYTLEQADAICFSRFYYSYYTLPYPVYGNASTYILPDKFNNEVSSFTCPNGASLNPGCSFNATESTNCSNQGPSVISCVYSYAFQFGRLTPGCNHGDVNVTGILDTGSEIVGLIQYCMEGVFVPVCGNVSGAGLDFLAKAACNSLGFSDAIHQVGRVYGTSPNINGISCDTGAASLDDCTIALGQCSAFGAEVEEYIYVRCFNACQVNISEVSCPLGYEFDMEQCQCAVLDACFALSPCQNGGTCIPGKERGSYRCSCPLYYTGYNCQGTSLFDVSQCGGSAAPVCKGRRLSAVCRGKHLRGETLPDQCDKLNYID